MLEFLWLPCVTTIAAIALSAILIKEFLKKRAGEIAVEGGADNDSATKNGTVERAARTCTSPPVNEKAISSGFDYEVFLSFRGLDTRAGFTDFLYTSLKDAGIRTFRDDKELRVGEEFAPELLQAIKQSKILIPIFSKEVRHQIGSYGEAFLSHENKKRYDEKTMRKWKATLKEVSFLNGWDLHNEPNRREGEFVRKITQEVFTKLKKAYLEVSDWLVNVDNHVDAIMEMIGIEASETRIIGIHGMGGIGKTTIAKIIYNKLLKNFENCCFLSNVRETSKLKGIQCLQHQLISNILNTKWIDIRNIDDGIKTIKERLSHKRVLLLLDDVEDKDHMHALVGNYDWFGKGSKLIITTRKKDVLIPEVEYIYEVYGMDDRQSLELFSRHAFRRYSPLDEYIDQSYRAIHIAKGLPLAIEIIGSLLSSTNKKMWDAKLDMLQSVPHDKVKSKLKISYDALDDRQQHIFLDIACCLIGYDKDIVVHFWDKSKFPEVALEVLQNMSLIKIEKGNKVWMHDQLRDLGREMVRQESQMKIEKQSRVWIPDEALDLLRRHKGKTKVEALRLHFDHERQYRFTCKDFKRISNLRFLQVDNPKECFRAEDRLLWHESPSNVLPINNFQENSDLLPQLRWLSWPKIPPTFKITNFSMEDVVILDLSWSEITQDWKGWSHMKVMKNLKVVNLTGCFNLERTPDFSAHSKLERLILQNCQKLVEIDVSICQLKSLVFLDVTSCGNLQRLPDKLGRDLASLEYLYLSNCISLERLPGTIRNLESLTMLHIAKMKIKELPDSIELLKNLKEVTMSGSAIRKIPNALWTMEKLEVIDAQTLHFFNVEIGNHISRNRSLRILKLGHRRIDVVPRLPESLITLQLSHLCMDMFPDLSNLTNLKELELGFVQRNSDGEFDGPVEEDLMQLLIESLHGESDGPVEEDPMPLRIGSLHGESDGPMEEDLPRWIGNLSKLESLDLQSPYVTALPTNLRNLLPQLKSLKLFCPNLRCLPSLPSNLLELVLCGSKSCCSLEDLSNLKTLSELHIINCAISEIRGLDRLENLRELHLWALQQVEILPDLRNLNTLWRLQVSGSSNLVEIQGELPPSLGELAIQECGSLQKLPDLSNLKGLQKFEIKHCGKLNVEAISSLCSEKRVKFEGDETNRRGEDNESGCKIQ